ncbi:MAG: TerB family tellurite resistance protein [Pseudomonadales bacterium]
MGKILGGGIGALFGGPIGAVLGAVIGHHALDAGGGFSFSPLETRQGLYFTAVFSMLGKLAKADGVVTRNEIEVIERVMKENFRLPPQARKLAIQIFNAAKDSDDRFEDYAMQLQQHFSDTPELLVSVVDLLMVVAHADHDLHESEERMIRSAVRIFGIESEFAQIKSRFTGVPDDINRYYEILGCSPGDDLAVIKKKYRKLAMQYHPDRIQSKGMAPEFAQAAEEKFKEIQHAYDLIEKDQINR